MSQIDLQKLTKEKPRVYPYRYPTIHQRWKNRR